MFLYSKMKMNKYYLFFLFLLNCSLAAAQEKVSLQQQEKIISEISLSAKKVSTIQCDFVQTKSLSIMNEKMVSKGKMYFQSPNKLRWQYTSPYDYTFIIADNKVLIGKGKNTNKIDLRKSQTFQEIARMIEGSVTGKCLTDKTDFDVIIQDSKDSYIAILTPKKVQMRKMFKRIVLTFNKAKRTVKVVEMVDANGDKTVITMQNIKQDEAIDNKMFLLD